MPRHTVKLLATIGACSALAFALPIGAGAEEFVTPHVNVPHVNVPKPQVNVPTVNSNAPTVNNSSTVNLQHRRLSTRTNTRANVNKLGGSQGNGTTATTAKTPFVGPSDTGGSAGAKVIIESVGGSGTPAQVQQQNGAAAAAAASAAAVGAASSGAGSPAKAWNPSLANSFANTVDGVGKLPSQLQSANFSLPTAEDTAAYFSALQGGAYNPAYAADVAALQAALTAAEDSPACVSDPNGSQCRGSISAAEIARNDFESLVDYLLGLLSYEQYPDFTGYTFTPAETADIEAALQNCLSSPSTCAATITQLNAELASLGVPSGYEGKGGGWIPVIYAPAHFAAESNTSASPNGNSSLSTAYNNSAGGAAFGFCPASPPANSCCLDSCTTGCNPNGTCK